MNSMSTVYTVSFLSDLGADIAMKPKISTRFI